MVNPASPAIFLPILLAMMPLPEFVSRPLPSTPLLRRVLEIKPPHGFMRSRLDSSGFGFWLRHLPLSADPVVYLYNGRPKANQLAHVAVLDVPVGKKDLQQCADACMRLRAEFLLDRGRQHEIVFRDNHGRAYRPGPYRDRASFERYLEQVYSYCGTLSLEKQLSRISATSVVQPGDLVIRGGSPGHAVIVLDMAEDSRGNRVYLLAQSYMPAQQIHILRNPSDASLSPWYRIVPGQELRTPEWIFDPAVVRRW
jgi:hypothetical protein